MKSTITDGLFGFDRNNHGGVAQPLAVPNNGVEYTSNILRGTLTDTAVVRGSIFALGRGQVMGTDGLGAPTAQSRIGFWPFAGTTLKAHRAYIPANDIPNVVNTGSSRGLTFSFSDEAGGAVTGIRNIASDLQEGWYTVSGVRLNGKPTEKGVYIHNGRKEVVR